MRLQNTFLFFLVDSMGRSAYWEDEIVKWSTEPKPLRFSPDGWKDTQISFVRSNKYFGINRQFTNPYKFVEDGASILRYLVYTGQSYETKIYLIVSKWNDLTDIYETYYRGEIDMVKMQDDPINGVTANMVEGDLLKLLNANDATEYEIPLTGDFVQVDGINLETRQPWQQLNIGAFEPFLNHLPPLGQLQGEGNPVNLIYGQQDYAEQATADADYYTESQNYLLKYSETATRNLEIQLSGNFPLTLISSGIDRALYYIYIIIATDTAFVSRTELENNLFEPAGEIYTFQINETITLLPGQKLFIAGRAFAGTPGDAVSFEFEYGSGQIVVNAEDVRDATLAQTITPYNLLNQLMQKVAGTHPFFLESDLLEENDHLLLTSGDGLRQIPDPVIKTTLAKFFDSFNKILFAGFGISGLNAVFETRQEYYDSTVNTIDLGEVSGLTISINEESLVNTAKIGYPVQDIEALNGRFSINNTNTFSLPVSKINKEYDQVSEYLTDPYVIENIRSSFTAKPTTDNPRDNRVFILNTVPARAGYTSVGMAYAGIQGYFFLFADFAANIADFTAGSFFIISNATEDIEGGYRVVSAEVEVDLTTLKVFVSPGTSDTVTISDIADISFPRTLKKESYSSITGVPANSNVYNIEQLTPKRMLNAHAPYYRSLLYFLTTEKIVFNTADRNQDLVTVLDGVTVTENADVRADTLGNPLFYPFVFSFKTRVPETFNSIFSNAVNGHIKFQFNGIDMYGFPLQMTAKPALNESQEWKLLASPANDIAALFDLLGNPLNTVEMSTYGLSFSKLCPVQMVPQGIAPLPPYNFLHMDLYSYAAQSNRYDGYRPYLQKWQTTDNIALQCITRDLGPVQVELINAHERVFGIYPLSQIVTTAVTSPYQLFEGDIPLLDVDPGIYWLRATAGIGDTKVIFLSEPQCIQDEHTKTLYLEYSNTRNQAATIFSTGYSPAIRVEGNIINFTPKSRFASYEDEPANMYMLDGTAYRQFTLFVGDSFGLPPYMADKINRVFTLNTVTIDGKGFVRGEDAQLEAVARTNGMPGTWWQMEIREAFNQDATSQDTEGVIDGGAILVNVDAALFGDLTDQVSSNPIQITVLQDN